MSRQISVASGPSPVLSDLLPGAWVRDVLLILVYAGAIGASAQLSVRLPFTPVPITGQTFAVLAGALVLGSWRAFAGTMLYLAAGLAGIPWFAAASGATLGYVFGFIVAATVVGYLAGRGLDRSPVTTVAVLVLGNLLIYLFGVTYLAASIDVSMSKAIELGAWPFLGGDAVKIALAALVVPGIWKSTGRER